MRIVLNGFEGSRSFTQALGELAKGADTLSVAVSYVQVGGWELFRENTQGVSLERMRFVCTDQLGITQPAAVVWALEKRVQIRNFVGNITYHSKVFFAQDRNGHPTRFLLGSANLSTSAFTKSFEAGVLSDDAAGLHTLKQWFDDLFNHNSEAFTPQLLSDMEVKWRAAAAMRAHNRLQARAESLVLGAEEPLVGPEDLDTLEDVLATIQLPVGLLNMDYAANNVRNISKVREVIANPDAAHEKQQSELKLLGFMRGGRLTDLGKAAAGAPTNADVARLWCEWLRHTPDAELREINSKLIVAKRVFPQFWRLREDVRDYFLENAERPRDRKTLQSIELLCNAQDVVQELSLDDIRTLSPLLQSERVPEYIRAEVAGYFDNKGVRSWDTDDRRVVPLAWHETEPR